MVGIIMDDNKTFRFALKDKLLDADITPSNVSLPLLADFINQVSSFLRGKDRISLGEVRTSVVEGSFALTVHDDTGLLDAAYEDYKLVKETHDISTIDPVRASVILEWQDAARSNDDRSYSFGFEVSDSVLDQLFIDDNTEFTTAQETWLNVELYIYGRVFDLGGKSKTNVHIELANGKTLKASTRPAVLIGDSENRLYRKQLLRINAEQNLDTMELRNERLISFEHYNPVVDEEQYETMSRRIKAAWRSVENITQWVEDLRGLNA